jgi:hypothetical protein
VGELHVAVDVNEKLGNSDVGVAPDLVDLGHTRGNHRVYKSLLLVFNRSLPFQQEIDEVSIRHTVFVDHLAYIFNDLPRLWEVYYDLESLKTFLDTIYSHHLFWFHNFKNGVVLSREFRNSSLLRFGFHKEDGFSSAVAAFTEGFDLFIDFVCLQAIELVFRALNSFITQSAL